MNTRFYTQIKNSSYKSIDGVNGTRLSTDIVTEGEKVKILIWQIISVIGLNIAYIIVISDIFDYYNFQYEFDFFKFIIGIFILLLSLGLGFKINKAYFSAIYNVIFLYLLCGQVIYYQYNPDVSIIQVIVIFSCLIFIFLFSRINKKFERPVRIKNSDFYIGLVTIFLFLPFLILFYNHINLKNLLFIDVYKTRAYFNGIKNSYTAYASAHLARILLPYLIVRKLVKKQHIMMILYIVMLLYLYLCGALKSIFIGLLALLVFYKGTYYKKTIFFIKGISFISFGGIIMYNLFDNIFILDKFVRRVLFVPARLGNITYEYFKDNLTYLSHSPFGFGIVDYPYDLGPAHYIGEVVIGTPGLSANTGVFTEGLMSFGLLGGIVAALICSLILLYFGMVEINPKYFGLIFVYIYYMNTSVLSTLLLTHGLFFLMFFASLFLREEGKTFVKKK
ncbi:hypothetical protein [Virgibacillus senegalensis]|uniref:hypothetical protein n=1 Tax=Virgibacillus senegalensis TaxID=1499679 RepID=UPI00069EB3CF|nr:hypothetical protein [Virgibacillus senegalensis]